ncbi:MAG: class I SAM-dependent methyltransferase [Chloroflexi bacterium]|nr:class I SAM-dependent methyltransferase [Chloroflexota bacterium]
MYSKSAAWYDAIYGYKNYEQEAQVLHKLIWERRRSAGRMLLDVACGTGRHLEYLQQHYLVKGLDINPELLAIAHQRCPGVEFYRADMVEFDLGYRVDVIVCLFSAIGYVKTVSRLEQALRTMFRHLKPGGLVIIEPWFSPDVWQPGTVHATFVDEPELKIARMTISEREGRLSRNNFHYLVATPDGVSHFTERHELGLFTHAEYIAAFQQAGLDAMHIPEGLTGRGLFLGVCPAA